MTTLLTEEQLLLRTSARSFLEERYPMTWVREWTEADAPRRLEMQRAVWKDLAEMGWLGLGVDEAHGGMGLGFVEQTIVLEELGRAVLPTPYLETLLGAAVVDASGPARDDLLPRIAAGELSLALATAEESGEEPSEWTTELGSGEGEPVLRGTKSFVPFAPLVDQLVVAARSADGSLVWTSVDREARGVEITARETMDQTRPLYRVSFDGAPARRLCEFAPAWQAVQAIHWAALAAEAVGGCERVLADTVAYAKERVQFGTPIGANQAIKHKCSNMLVRTEATRAIAYHAAREQTAGGEGASLACSMAKAYATEAYREVASEGIQIHGGVGFTWEFDCHFFYKRARANEITAGHPDEHRERVAAGAGL